LLREASRAREQCEDTRCGLAPEAWASFSRYLRQFGKHTDGRACGLPDTYTKNWTNAWFVEQKAAENSTTDPTFAGCERGTLEQRLALLAALDATKGTAFGRSLKQRVAALDPGPLSDDVGPSHRPVSESEWSSPITLSTSSYTTTSTNISSSNTTIELRLNATTGSLVGLAFADGAQWASPSHQLAELWYKTESQAWQIRWALRCRAQGFNPWCENDARRGCCGWTEVSTQPPSAGGRTGTPGGVGEPIVGGCQA